MLSPRGNIPLLPIQTGDEAISSLIDKRLRAIAASYRDWAGDKPIAARADIVPRKIPRLLPYILLFDRVTQRGRTGFGTRLCGSEIVDMLRFDATGQFIDANAPKDDISFRIARTQTMVIETRAPVRASGNLRLAGREFVHFEAIFFPLSEDGKTIEKIIGGVARSPVNWDQK